MNSTSVNFNISNAENGYIVNRTMDVETEKDNSFSSTYTSETFVFSTWDEVLGWLKNANEVKAS